MLLSKLIGQSRRRTWCGAYAALVVIGFLTTILRANEAQAYRIIVRYDDTGNPGPQTQFQMVRVIQSAMREWETLGQGKVVLEWGGVSTNRVVGTGNIAIFWDASTPGCASILNQWALPLSNGALRLHPMRLHSIDAPTSAPFECEGIRGVVLHELAHYFEQTTPPHPQVWDSILNWEFSGAVRDSWMTAAAAGYRQTYHLWNADIDLPPCGVWGKLSFCPHSTTAVVRDYNPVSTAVATMSQFPVERPNTTAIATGGTGNSYTFVASNASTTWVNQGSGASWSVTATINEGSFHRKCLATSVNSNDMLMAWPNATEEAIPGFTYTDTPSNNLRLGQIGARSIRYTMSHDGGHTWDPVQNMPLPTVLTRNGISCGWNPARAKFVLAWQSATTEIVRFAERDSLGGWTIQSPSDSTGAVFARTHEPPNLYFDPFGDGTGVLVWQESADLLTRMSRVNFDVGMNWYQLSEITERDACIGAFGCGVAVHHRNLMIPATMDGFPQEAHSYAWLVGTAGVQYRLRRRDSWMPITSLTESVDSNATPAASSPLTTYQQFAEDRIFVRRALLETQIASQ